MVPSRDQGWPGHSQRERLLDTSLGWGGGIHACSRAPAQSLRQDLGTRLYRGRARDGSGVGVKQEGGDPHLGAGC